MVKPDQKPQLPEAVFHAVATIIQRLVYIVDRECGIAPMDLLTLWFVDYFGKPNEDGESVILRRTLTLMLARKFGMTSGQMNKAIDSLGDKNLVRRTTISREERKRLFGAEDGPRLVLILTSEGVEKFTLFKASITQRYERWLSSLSAPSRIAVNKVVLPLAIQTGSWVIRRYDPLVLSSAENPSEILRDDPARNRTEKGR
jgi:DNA-binding MarR family transcriptional regulator